MTFWEDRILAISFHEAAETMAGYHQMEVRNSAYPNFSRNEVNRKTSVRDVLSVSWTQLSFIIKEIQELCKELCKLKEKQERLWALYFYKDGTWLLVPKENLALNPDHMSSGKLFKCSESLFPHLQKGDEDCYKFEWNNLKLFLHVLY